MRPYVEIKDENGETWEWDGYHLRLRGDFTPDGGYIAHSWSMVLDILRDGLFISVQDEHRLS